MSGFLLRVERSVPRIKRGRVRIGFGGSKRLFRPFNARVEVVAPTPTLLVAEPLVGTRTSPLAVVVERWSAVKAFVAAAASVRK
jgi:hypothetical protein